MKSLVKLELHRANVIEVYAAEGRERQAHGIQYFFVLNEGSSGSSLNRYDFNTRNVSKVKSFSDKTIRGMSISPDGDWLVVEFGKTLEESVLSLVVSQKTIPELWVMRLDGSDLRLLVKNGQAPAWRLS